jgi:hypothetical protein
MWVRQAYTYLWEKVDIAANHGSQDNYAVAVDQEVPGDAHAGQAGEWEIGRMS